MSPCPPLASLLALAIGCGGSTSSPDAAVDTFDRSAMLAHLTTNLLLPLQTEVAARTSVMAPRIAAYCDALDAGTGDPARTVAVAAWAEAMDAWERAEALLIGPAAMDNRALRDRIYGWPLLSTCGLDRDTASRWADPGSYDLATRLANVRSLAAIEYLLYATSAAHSCATVPVGWDALGGDLPRARCRLAQAIAFDVDAAASANHAAWRADGGDFAGTLARAGQGGSSIASAHAGVNLISDGMFYVDRMVKDMKLGEPAGITVNVCGTVQQPCLREVELPYADRSSFAIRANLVALRHAFTGATPTADGPGFDDFLRALGSDALADRMTANLDAAIARANALPDSFTGALAQSYAAIVDTHAAVTLFTDDLKSQFLTILALEIPDDVAADND
jgi:uncharacterized protein